MCIMYIRPGAQHNHSVMFPYCKFRYLADQFLKNPLNKGQILQSGRGVNSILIAILRFWPSSWKDKPFAWRNLFRLVRVEIRGSFSKKLSKTELTFRFCKIGLRNTLFICGSKMVVCFVLLQSAILCPILANLFQIEGIFKLRMMLLKKTLLDVRLGNY